MTEYHYLITLQVQIPRGTSTHGVEGTVQAAKGTTRRQLFRDIYESARQAMHPVPDNAVVLFFSLDRNDLR